MSTSCNFLHVCRGFSCEHSAWGTKVLSRLYFIPGFLGSRQTFCFFWIFGSITNIEASAAASGLTGFASSTRPPTKDTPHARVHTRVVPRPASHTRILPPARNRHTSTCTKNVARSHVPNRSRRGECPGPLAARLCPPCLRGHRSGGRCCAAPPARLRRPHTSVGRGVTWHHTLWRAVAAATCG